MFDKLSRNGFSALSDHDGQGADCIAYLQIAKLSLVYLKPLSAYQFCSCRTKAQGAWFRNTSPVIRPPTVSVSEDTFSGDQKSFAVVNRRL